MSADLVGWVSSDPVYSVMDGYVGNDLELYADGHDLGESVDLIHEIGEFAGRRVRIVIEALDEPGEASNTRNSPDGLA